MNYTVGNTDAEFDLGADTFLSWLGSKGLGMIY